MIPPKDRLTVGQTRTIGESYNGSMPDGDAGEQGSHNSLDSTFS